MLDATEPRHVCSLADSAPEVMLSLVTNAAIPSGLKQSVSEHLRHSDFPYVVPASAV
jgi:hypothetical protein